MRTLLPRLRASVALPAVSIAALWIAVPACEPRIEEPLPPKRTEDSSQAEPSPEGAAAPKGDSGRRRCIKSLPAKPTRTATPGPDPKCPADPETPPKLRTGKVVFKDAKEQAVTVEIANTEESRQRGLMYRTKMADDHGMIFLFNERTNHTFWMHNTCISLDMMFIDEDGVIVGIEESTPTMNDSTFEVGCASKFVLEVNAGWSRKNGVMPGQRVEIQGI